MRNHIRMLAAFIALIIGATLTLGPSLAQNGTGTLSGTVYRADGVTPIAGATIAVFEVNASNFFFGSTNASGAYSVSGVFAGTYTVSADASGFVPEYYDQKPDQPSAGTISVTGGSTVSGITFTLDAAGEIRGTVTDSSTGLPVQNASVSAVLEGRTFTPGLSALTNASGQYAISVTTGAGAYQVSVSRGGYLSETWDNQRNPALANPVSVSNGVITPNINFALDRAASISGTVYAPNGTTPVNWAEVTLTHTVTGVTWRANSGSNGVYTIDTVPAGTYTVRGLSGVHGMVWDDQKPSAAAAAVFTLTSGAPITGANVRFLPPGTISGTISAAGGGGGEADPALAARPYLPGSVVVGTAALDFDGQFLAQRGVRYSDYLADELAAGGPLTDPLRLIRPELTRFDDDPAAMGAWVQSSSPTADGMVDPDSVVGGTVTAYLINPAFDYTDSAATFQTTIGANGAFTIASAPPGLYRIQASAPGYTPEYAYQTHSLYRAPLTAVTSGNTTSVAIALDPAGTVTGRAVGPDGVTGLADRVVYWQAANHDIIYRCTGADGSYTLPDVPRNVTFTVHVLASRTCLYLLRPGVEQAYQNGARQFFPPGVSVLNNINFSFASTGQLTGRVLRADGMTPIQGAYVYLYDAADNFVRMAQTGADGRYTVSGLGTGLYTVELLAGRSGGYSWISARYGATIHLPAQRIPVTNGVTTPDIDFITAPLNYGVVSAGGSISGRVTLPDGVNGATAGRVQLWREEAPDLYKRYSAFSLDSTGFGYYRFDALLPGNYIVSADVDGSVTYFYHSSIPGDREIIPIGASAVTGIDITAPGGARVSGVITDGVSGARWHFPMVYVYHKPSISLVGMARTAFDGSWSIQLPPGTYTAYATAFPIGALTFNGGGISYGPSQTFVVSSADVSGITIALGRWGEVIGRVTRTDGTTPIASRLINARPDNAFASYTACSLDNGAYGHAYAYLGYANILFSYNYCGREGGGWVEEYWREAMADGVPEPVTLTLGQRFATGINFTLARFLRGDADQNEVVDIADFSILASTFGKTSGMSGYNNRADFNNDFQITIVDFSLLAANFGVSVAP